MSKEEAVFHQGRWWAQRGGEWLVYVRGAWRSPSEASAAAASGRDVAALALGLFGALVAFLYPAIGLVVALISASTAIVLGIAALAATKGDRKPLALRAVALFVATGAWVLAVFGAVNAAAYFAAVFLIPMVIGMAAIGLGIAWLASRSSGGRGMAKVGLVLGIATVAMCAARIASVNRALEAPNPAVDSHREAVPPWTPF